MQLKLTGTAMGAGLAYLSGIAPLIPLGGFLGWQLATFLSEKEIDREKIIYGTPGENGSYANYKRILPNSIRWSKYDKIKRMGEKEDENNKFI